MYYREENKLQFVNTEFCMSSLARARSHIRARVLRLSLNLIIYGRIAISTTHYLKAVS